MFSPALNRGINVKESYLHQAHFTEIKKNNPYENGILNLFINHGSF